MTGWELQYLHRCEMSLSNSEKWIRHALQELPGCIDEGELLKLAAKVKRAADAAREIIRRIEEGRTT